MGMRQQIQIQDSNARTLGDSHCSVGSTTFVQRHSFVRFKTMEKNNVLRNGVKNIATALIFCL